MRPQLSVFLRALCLLLSMAPVFCKESASNITTNGMATTMEYRMNATESASPTTKPPTTITFNMKVQDTPTISTMSSKPPNTTTETVPSKNSPTTTSSQQSHLNAGVNPVVCLILFFCFLIMLFFCAYKWYTRHGRPSLQEIWRSVAESARNIWAVAVEWLRPSSKEEEEDEEMEAGIREAEEQKKQGGDDDNDNDSSNDYSSMDGTVMMERPKKDEEEDGQSNEREDDMMSVELKDEKTAQEKDDLTVL